MGLDWHRTGWPEYQLHLAGWNAAQGGDTGGGGPRDPERLKRFVDAHTVH